MRWCGTARATTTRKSWARPWPTPITCGRSRTSPVARPVTGKATKAKRKRMSKQSESNLKLISAGEIKAASPDVETVRRKLSQAVGPKYWRTLEELSGEKAFGELLEREF